MSPAVPKVKKKITPTPKEESEMDFSDGSPWIQEKEPKSPPPLVTPVKETKEIVKRWPYRNATSK